VQLWASCSHTYVHQSSSSINWCRPMSGEPLTLYSWEGPTLHWPSVTDNVHPAKLRLGWWLGDEPRSCFHDPHRFWSHPTFLKECGPYASKSANLGFIISSRIWRGCHGKWPFSTGIRLVWCACVGLRLRV